MNNLLKFDQAIDASGSENFKKRHLLLGNGFSIACCPEIFTYGSLFERADFSRTPNLDKVFDVLGTNDFEKVIRALDDASKTVPIYADDISATNEVVNEVAKEMAKEMAKGALALKDILIHTIADNHPNIPNEIADMQFWACRKFLYYFLGNENDKGKVYTLNYDLLLYWALMHDDMGFDEPIELDTNDGFGRDENTDPDFVDWMGERIPSQQRVHYLHGALHLFDAGSELQKYTWSNTALPLLEQARTAMLNDKFPLFVAEGASEQKLTKIKHSAYLYHSYKSFTQQMKQAKDALFIFGHKLDKTDDHILECIIEGKIPQVYVSLYGDPESKENKRIRSSAKQLEARRGDKNPLKVEFFDADSANIWGC